MSFFKSALATFSAFVMFFCLASNCFAGSSLSYICTQHGLQYYRSVKVVNLMTESYDDGFDVQFTNNTHIYWMQFGAGYNNRMELFNLLKTAYLTQAPIDVCVNNDGLFFIGASMKVY